MTVPEDVCMKISSGRKRIALWRVVSGHLTEEQYQVYLAGNTAFPGFILTQKYNPRVIYLSRVNREYCSSKNKRHRCHSIATTTLLKKIEDGSQNRLFRFLGKSPLKSSRHFSDEAPVESHKLNFIIPSFLARERERQSRSASTTHSPTLPQKLKFCSHSVIAHF